MNTRQSTPHEILVASTVDAMNRYVSQVLIPAKLIDAEAWRNAQTGTGSELCELKYRIAEDIAARWSKALELRTHEKHS